MLARHAEDSVQPDASSTVLLLYLQGLDPRSIANLFSDAVCIGEKILNNEECFILKLEAGAATLQERSAPVFDIIHHTVWGYFSQRTGLLIQLEDSHLLRMKSGKGHRRSENIFWETSMESVISDYRAASTASTSRTAATPTSRSSATARVRQPQAQAGGDVDGGGRFQCARPHHGLLPAAGRPQEGRRRSE